MKTINIGDTKTIELPTVSVTGELFTSAFGTPVPLAHQKLVSGTVVVTDGTTTYTEGTDYTIDYPNGTITVLSTGNMADNTQYSIDYSYYIVGVAETEYKISEDQVMLLKNFAGAGVVPDGTATITLYYDPDGTGTNMQIIRRGYLGKNNNFDFSLVDYWIEGNATNKVRIKAENSDTSAHEISFYFTAVERLRVN